VVASLPCLPLGPRRVSRAGRGARVGLYVGGLGFVGVGSRVAGGQGVSILVRA
jgi:hypothetical protein